MCMRLTECSSWSIVWARTGLKDTGDRAPGFFLTALICSKALKAERGTNTHTHTHTPVKLINNSSRQTWTILQIALWKQLQEQSGVQAAVLTQPADWTVVGLVTQRICAGVAQTQMPAGQDERIPQVGQTHDTLVAVVAVLVVWRLEEQKKSNQGSHTCNQQESGQCWDSS